MPRRSTTEAADRLASALHSGVTTTGDPDLDSAIAASRALAPSIRPREAFRSALAERILHDFDNDARTSSPTIGLVKQVDTDEVPMHSISVFDAVVGAVTLADLEPISVLRAREITARLAEITARTAE